MPTIFWRKFPLGNYIIGCILNGEFKIEIGAGSQNCNDTIAYVVPYLSLLSSHCTFLEKSD
jgi:hypothetical protein